MHHLHPRSRSTSTLFTTTLAVSFLVVALPHLIPCPVDRRQFADSAETYTTADGKVKRRRKRTDDEKVAIGSKEVDMLDEGRRKQRECPVPKPGGLVGQMMGFEQREKDRPVQVIVKSVRERNIRKDSVEEVGGDGR